MKKLDEIMELMADEMADFKAAVLKLKELSKEIRRPEHPNYHRGYGKEPKYFSGKTRRRKPIKAWHSQ